MVLSSLLGAKTLKCVPPSLRLREQNTFIMTFCVSLSHNTLTQNSYKNDIKTLNSDYYGLKTILILLIICPLILAQECPSNITGRKGVKEEGAFVPERPNLHY